MTYAVLDDLVSRFGSEELVQLTDRVNMPPTTIDADQVAKALADAGAEIDTYLAVAYTLPLAAVPPRLVKVASDMARFYLHGKAADESVRAGYEDAVKWLAQVSKGIASLGLASADEAPVPAGGVERVTPAANFDPLVLKDF